MLPFTKRKLFQTNQYSKVSLIISALKKNHIDFQVKENDINARYGVFGMDKATSIYISLEKQTLSTPYMSEEKITILHYSCFIHP